MTQRDHTHDPALHSWVESANAAGTDFPIQNLPFAAFSCHGATPRIGVGIGDAIIDVAAAAPLLQGLAAQAAQACAEPVLNPLMALGGEARRALRAALSHLLDARRTKQTLPFFPQRDVRLHTPVQIRGFTDFFASIDHASNAGRLFRPEQPLLPNYRYVPVAYNGRANSILCGTDIERPRGQLRPPGQEAPAYEACQRLDYEVELGAYIGQPSARWQPVPVEQAWEHIFGFSLLNDWSARDMQSWEYQPLGPFLAKSFATSVAPWIVTPEALAPFRIPARVRSADEPAPLPHLHGAADQALGALDITMELQLRSEAMARQDIAPVTLSRGNTADLYWTYAQMVAHHTSNGSTLDAGDLLGSGTVSGSLASSWGSLLELTHGGKEPIRLPNGETRSFLADGDEVILRGYCERPGCARIGFGECAARILPAREVRA